MKILLIALLFLPLALSAQKVKLDDKTHIVTVDGVNSFIIERFGCGFGLPDCHFDVHDLDSNKVIVINYKQFNSPVERKPSNPDGRVDYFEFVFLKSGKKAEIDAGRIKSEKVAELMVKNKFFVAGKLNDQAVDEFVLIHGTPFSQRVKF